MRKLPTGEPCAGEPPARFGGRGGREPFPTPIKRRYGLDSPCKVPLFLCMSSCCVGKSPNPQRAHGGGFRTYARTTGGPCQAPRPCNPLHGMAEVVRGPRLLDGKHEVIQASGSWADCQ